MCNACGMGGCDDCEDEDCWSDVDELADFDYDNDPARDELPLAALPWSPASATRLGGVRCRGEQRAG